MASRYFAKPLAVLLLLLCGTGFAQDYEKFDDSWRFYLGGFRATVDSKISINGEELPPVPPVDLEDLLGVANSKTVAWGGIGWRFAPRHVVEAEFFTLSRSASVTRPFDPPLQIGDTILESGTVATGYDTDIHRLTYGFSVLRNERSNLQLKAGLHVASLTATFGISGAVCDPTTTPSTPPGCPPLGDRLEGESVSAPLPHFGASYLYALTPDIGFRVNAIGFAVEIDDIDGSILELGADLVWQPFRHVGFGAGYRYFRVDVTDSGSSSFDGNFEFVYQGPSVYVQATF